MLINMTSTRASATHDVELDHACGVCEKTSPAWVRGKATIVENRTGIEAGGSDAQFLAETEAQRNAALLIRIARCPHCTRRDPEQMRKLWMRFVWVILAVEVAHALFALIGATDDYARVWLRAAPTMFGAALVLLISVGSKTWVDLRASDTRVRFLKETKSEAVGPYRSAR
jgi:hypothetical protein